MTAAVVTAVIGAVGTVLAAWVQGRAQRSAKPAVAFVRLSNRRAVAGTSDSQGRGCAPQK